MMGPSPGAFGETMHLKRVNNLRISHTLTQTHTQPTAHSHNHTLTRPLAHTLLLTISSCLKVISRFCWAFLTSHRCYNRENKFHTQEDHGREQMFCICVQCVWDARVSGLLTFLRSSRSSCRFLLSSTQMVSVMLSDSWSLWAAYSFSSFSTSWNACWLLNLRTHRP